MKTLFAILFAVLLTPALALADSEVEPPTETVPIGITRPTPIVPVPFLSLGFAPVLVPAPGSTPAVSVPLVYVMVDTSILVPINDHFSFIAGIGVDVAPVAGNWGFYGYATAEFNLTPWMALDLNGLLMHDWDPTLRDSRGQPNTGYAGGGVGLAFFLPNGMAIVPGVAVLGNLEGMGASVSPSLVASFPLPAFKIKKAPAP